MPAETPPVELRGPARAGAAAATALFLLVLVNWSWRLQPFRYTSDFYDIQARRLFHGHLTVPLERIGLEAFEHDGNHHLYFGIFPTLLRMPVLLVTDRFDGRLTQPSMALAWLVLLVAVRGLAWRTRVLVRGPFDVRPVDRADRAVAFAAPLLVAAATPVLFLASVTAVYHEAILWGLAASLLAFERLFALLATPSPRAIAHFGAAAFVATTSRAAVGIAPCAAAGVVAVVVVIASAARAPQWSRRTATRLREMLAASSLELRGALLLALAAVVPVAAHVVVNEARFGTAMSPPYASQVWTEISPERRLALEANGGSLFNVRYVPSTALAYLRPDGAELSRAFPFVWFDPPARVVGDVVFDTRDRTASLTALSPALALAALAGLWWMSRARRASTHRGPAGALAVAVLMSTVATFGVLTIGFVAQRYEGDLLVPAALLALPGAHLVADRLARPDASTRRTRLVAAGAAVALVWSGWANLSVALLYQRLYVPVHDADRNAFVELQLAIDGPLPGAIGHLAGPEPPVALAPAGTFHVTGDCRVLSWSDGTRWLALEPRTSGATPLCRKLVDR